MFSVQPIKSLSAALVILAASAASAATIDTTTEGNWIGVYGKGGYILTAFDNTVDRASLPSFVSGYSSTPTAQYEWATGTSDPRALQDPAHPSVPSDRNAATTYGGDFTFTVNVSKATDFNLSVYALDWDTTGRDITLTVNGDAVRVNNTTPGLTDAYHNGEWVTWNVNAPVGPLNIDVTLNGGVNAVISAVMFSPEPSSFILGGLGLVGLLVAARRGGVKVSSIRLALVALLMVLANRSDLRAATIIGPGDVSGGNTSNLTTDTGVPYVAVDEGHPMFLAAGTYSATLFSHQFIEATGGSVIPALEIVDGSDYKTIAVGSTLTNSATESSFTSTAFGGSHLFTVPAGGETVYAAVFQTTSLAPIGFVGSADTTFFHYNGANAPVVGSDLSGGATTHAGRAYDFSITVNAVVTPEPSTMILGGLGLVGLLVACRRSKA